MVPCIKTVWICHWNGTFTSGICTSKMIVNNWLAVLNKDGERVETAKGHHCSAPYHVKLPGRVCADPKREQMAGRVQSRQDIINKITKQ